MGARKKRRDEIQIIPLLGTHTRLADTRRMDGELKPI
jgi:hypothetical protein